MTHENLSSGLPNRSDTNWAVKPMMARGFKIQIWKVDGLYYLCSENKGADQLHRCAAVPVQLIYFFVFAYAGFLMTWLICLMPK